MSNDVEIVVKVTNQGAAGAKAAMSDVDKIRSKTESAGKAAVKWGALTKVGGLAVEGAAHIAGAAIHTVSDFFVQGVKDAASYQVLQKKTAQVIKSTGNEAHISVKGIQNLASSLESMSGVDEELIINSQNVLATFTGIKNVGKDKIFDQATKSALDMSVALGVDLQGASIQVGKALNDPVKGITALSRVGVSFTDQQKKVIASLVKTGDTAGAQKVILKELNKEFGGAAQAAGNTFAGSVARAKDVLADTGRTIGQALLPKLTHLVDKFAKELPKAISNFQRGYNGMKLNAGDSSIAKSGAEVRDLQTALGGAGAAFGSTSGKAVTWGSILSAQLDDVTSFATDLTQEWDVMSTGAVNAWHRIDKEGTKSGEDIDKMFGKLPGSIGRHFDEAAARAEASQRRIQIAINATSADHLQAEIGKMETGLRRLGQEKPTPKVDADIRRLTAKVAAARRQLASLHNVKLTVTTVFKKVGSPYGGPGQGLGVIAPGQAHGGVIGAAASGGVRNGLTMVGEHGRELVNLAPGSQVHSNGDTERMMAGGGGVQTIILSVEAGNDTATSAWLALMIRNFVRVKGAGNVQTAFGKN